MSWLKKYFGPSTLVAAAFIGPGTVTTCTLAGAETGYSLLWAMLFSTLATIILQEMSARLGWATGSGLGEAINQVFRGSIWRPVAMVLVISAIVVGNGAYEAGNISGGVMGLELLAGETKLWPILIGALCFMLLFLGRYQVVEKILIALVILMSLCFLLTAFLAKPDLAAILNGFIPTFSSDNLLLILALLGTTVVPYNLFLHASTISKKWNKTASLAELRKENAVSIALGGLISMLIIITAGSQQDQLAEVANAQDLAQQLKPLLGEAAHLFMGVGLFAAGITSALTAPLAAAYAAIGLFSWGDDERDIRFRMIWMLVLGCGIAVACLGKSPILIIKFAQVANALLLPLIAFFLIYVCNSKRLMGKQVNSKLMNGLGFLILVIAIGLSIRSLDKVLSIF